MSRKFMAKYIVKNKGENPYNIQSMTKREFYNINEKSISKFSKSLGIILEKNREMGLHFLFRPPKEDEYTQFRFDIDLIKKGEDKPNVPLYNEDQIKKTVNIINTEVSDKVEGITDFNLTSCLLTKDMYYDSEKKRWKNGIHLQYPFLYLKNYEIINLVKTINKRLINVFSEEFFSPDNSFPKNGWLVYGCNKKGETDRYKCSVFYDSYAREIKDEWGDKVSLFWLYPLNDKFNFKFKIDDVNELDGKEDREDDSETEDDEENKTEGDTNEDFIFEKLASLSQKRVEETKYWRVIVCSVYKFSKLKNLNMDKVFEIVNEWSKKTDMANYCFEGLKRLWKLCEENPEKNNVKEFSFLKYWAIDNKKDRLFILGTDLAICELIYILYKGEIYMKNKDEGWFWDKKSLIWKIVNKEEIYNNVIDELILTGKKLYREQLTKEEKNMSGATSGTKVDKKEFKKSSSINKTLLKIQGVNYSKVMGMLTKFCLKEDFEDKLNSIKDLLPIKGGKVVNLVSGEVSERKKEHYFTFESDITLKEKTEKGDKFFLDLANGNSELALYLQKLTLYAISGFTFDRSFYQLTGVGRNGKSTFFDIISYILKDCYGIASKSLVIKDKKHGNKNDGPNPFILALRGKRCVSISETEYDDILNASSLKNLTGGDELVARNLYSKDIVKFTNHAKIFISSNFPLSFYNSDKAVEDRYKHIKFDNIFEKNADFKEEITTNKTGLIDEIFTSALNAGKSSLSEGKLLCNSVQISTQELFKELDTVQSFLDEYCDVEDKDEKTFSVDLYNMYKNYCKNNDIENGSDKFFSKEIQKKGFKKGKSGNKNCYFGIKITQFIY